MSPRPEATAAQRIYGTLRERLAGRGGDDASLSWCTPGVLQAVSVALPGSTADAGVDLWLGADARVGDVPRRWRLAGGGWLPLRPRRAPRPRVQFASASNEAHDSGSGTVAALVRDRLHPERLYALSCGHVFAGSTRARVGDAIRIRSAAADGLAHLVDWVPAIGADVYRTGLDAAIARVDDPVLLAALRAAPWPSGISSTYRLDAEVEVNAVVTKSGRLKTRWSGLVDIDGTERGADYFLEDAIGYRADPPTEAGDSGAAVWDRPGQRLLGIHVAAPAGDERWRSNAVFCPIERIMQWFDIEPLTRGGADLLAAPGAAAAPAAAFANAVAGGPTAEVDTVAKTLWGEARGEGLDGMRAVACVIGNRTARRWRNKSGFAAVCLDRWQFSCWNANDPNRARLATLDRRPDAAFTQALQVAHALVGGQLADFTFGATHYYASSLVRRPAWALGKTPCLRQGRHLFFNDID